MRKFPSNLTDLVATLREFVSKDTRPMSLIARADVCDRLTKKSRSTKEPLPSWAEGLHSVTRQVVGAKPKQGDYTTAVQNQQAKAGNDKDFVAEESKVSKPIEDFPNSMLREGLNNSDQLYVRVYVDVYNVGGFEQYYFNADGADVTHLVDDQFKADFFPKKYSSKKQADAGVAKEIKPREYKAENIIYLAQGEKVFNNLSDALLKKFNLELED